MKNCLHCKYADWARTTAGKLHPSGDGRCRYKWELPKLPASMYWIGGVTPSPNGGYISRKEELNYHCVYFARNDLV